MIPKIYEKVLRKIARSKIQTISVLDWVENKYDTNKPVVVVRLDVDPIENKNHAYTLNVAREYYELMLKLGVTGSFYFLLDKARYYDLTKDTLPFELTESGFEVGLHSDHLYGELTYGISGIPQLKNDLITLGKICGKKVAGVIAHGHNEINKLSRSNLELYQQIAPKDLGLIYHEKSLNYTSKYYGTKYLTDDNGLRSYWCYSPWSPILKLNLFLKNTAFMLMFHTEDTIKKPCYLCAHDALISNIIEMYHVVTMKDLVDNDEKA